MSLASFTRSRSVTGLSESAHYHYEYSSICDTIHNLAKTSLDYDKMWEKIYGLLKSYEVFDTCTSGLVESSYLLQIDVCNAEKGASRCLENRTQNYKANNQVVGNKPVSPGYAISFVNIHSHTKNWSIPLLSSRVDLEESEIACAHRQLKMLLDSPNLPFSKNLSIAVLDSKYGNAGYLSSVYAHKNLVSITRFRRGTKVYCANVALKTGNSQGAPPQYGQAYTLIAEDRLFCGTNKSGKYEKMQNSLFNLSTNDFHSEIIQTSKGRELRVEVHRWNDMKIRTKNGNNMKDKLLDICCVHIFDAKTNELVFDMVTELVEVKNFGFPLMVSEKMKFLPKMDFFLTDKDMELNPFFASINKIYFSKIIKLLIHSILITGA